MLVSSEIGNFAGYLSLFECSMGTPNDMWRMACRSEGMDRLKPGPASSPSLVELAGFDNSSTERDPSFYKNLVDNLYEGVYFVDRERTILYWNRGAERLAGYSCDEAVGKHCFDNFLMHVDEKGCALCTTGCPLKSTIEDGKSRTAEIYLRHKLGHRVPVRVRASPIRDTSGRIIGAVESFTDLTATKWIERRVGELEGLAFSDPLTGLPNRRFVQLKVEQALQEVEQFGRSAGLLMLDVDNFKNVNDRWGHQTGDLVLQATARTLAHTLRPTDVVGRWGGEEFIVILLNTKPGLLGQIAERCRMLIEKNGVLVDNAHVQITVSIGATLLLPGDSGQSAISRADELMYQSKTSGRNRITAG